MGSGGTLDSPNLSIDSNIGTIVSDALKTRSALRSPSKRRRFELNLIMLKPPVRCKNFKVKSIAFTEHTYLNSLPKIK